MAVPGLITFAVWCGVQESWWDGVINNVWCDHDRIGAVFRELGTVGENYPPRSCLFSF